MHLRRKMQVDQLWGGARGWGRGGGGVKLHQFTSCLFPLDDQDQDHWPSSCPNFAKICNVSTVYPFLKQDSLIYVQVLRTQVWTQDSCLITQMDMKNIGLVFSGPNLGMICWMSLGFAELLRKKDLSLSPTQLEICSSKVNSFSSWRRKHLYGSGGADPPIWYHCADVCFWGNSSLLKQSPRFDFFVLVFTQISTHLVGQLCQYQSQHSKISKLV